MVDKIKKCNMFIVMLGLFYVDGQFFVSSVFEFVLHIKNSKCNGEKDDFVYVCKLQVLFFFRKVKFYVYDCHWVLTIDI